MTVKQRTDIRREQIARAALEVAGLHGFSGITAKRVAEKVGFAPSALYRHYPGRAAIIGAVLDLFEGFAAEAMAKARAEACPMDGLHSLLMSMAETLRNHRALPLVIGSEEVWSGPPEQQSQVRRIFAAERALLIELFSQAQRRGLARNDMEPEQIVPFFFGMFMPTAMFSIRMPGMIDFDGQIQCNWKLFTQAVRRENGTGGNEDSL